MGTCTSKLKSKCCKCCQCCECCSFRCCSQCCSKCAAATTTSLSTSYILGQQQHQHHNCEITTTDHNSIYCQQQDCNEQQQQEAFNLNLSKWPQLYDCPIIYWLNLERSHERRELMMEQFQSYQLVENQKRIIAYDGGNIEDINAMKLMLCQEDLQYIYSKNIDWKIIAVTLGHLKMIQTFLESSTITTHDIMIGFEDDVDLCYVEKWQRPIIHYIKYLPDNWDIIQLGSQGPHTQKLMELNHKEFLTVGWRLRHYGAFAYAIHRRGMKKLIDRHWNSDTQKWQLRLSPGIKNYNTMVADSILYDGMESYTSTIPWFVYHGKDSTIHPEYIEHHQKHLHDIKDWYVQKQQENINMKFYSEQHDSQSPQPHHMTKFVFIVSGYNNSNDVERCLSSLCEQYYPRSYFRIVYGDDASTDNTFEIIHKWILENKQSDQITVIKNQQRGYACKTRHTLIKDYTNSDEIIILIDGDDCLADPYVLAYLDTLYYKNSQLWITYGGYSSQCGKRTDWGDWTELEKSTTGGIRQSGRWYASPLRTFRQTLYYNHIKVDDLKDDHGQWWKSATDVALMIPLLELAGPQHSCHIQQAQSQSQTKTKNKRIMYLYTIHDNQQYRKSRVQSQRDNHSKLCQRQPYTRLD